MDREGSQVGAELSEDGYPAGPEHARRMQGPEGGQDHPAALEQIQVPGAGGLQGMGRRDLYGGRHCLVVVRVRVWEVVF